MIRVDVYLVAEGYSKSRESAQKSIESGLVVIDGKPIKKPSEKIDESLEHSVTCENSIAYVGRGGLKLEAALDAFGIDPSGKTCFDIGASTGGFTDCMLQNGAAKVYAVDVGRGQLDWKLRISLLLAAGLQVPSLWAECTDFTNYKSRTVNEEHINKWAATHVYKHIHPLPALGALHFRKSGGVFSFVTSIQQHRISSVFSLILPQDIDFDKPFPEFRAFSQWMLQYL